MVMYKSSVGCEAKMKFDGNLFVQTLFESLLLIDSFLGVVSLSRTIHLRYLFHCQHL